MRVAISGGGTAGHVYPGLALADAIKSEVSPVEILFVGVEPGIEKELVPKAGFTLKTLRLDRFKRKIALSNLRAFSLLIIGFVRSISILRQFRPDIVVGFGGYASVPLSAAAVFLRVPYVLHEANAVAGLANRLLGRGAEAIAISFPEASSFFSDRKKVVMTGMPVRLSILKGTREEAARFLGLDPEIKTVLIFGGSLGARTINQATLDALPFLSSSRPLQIIHLTGMIDFDSIQARVKTLGDLGKQLVYRCFPYFERMNLAYAVSDLVVSRAGASTLAEIMTRGIPAILIPYPHATAAHQEKNARSLERRGAVEVILNQELNGKRLAQEVDALIWNPARLSEMKKNLSQIRQPDAAKQLARLILNIASQK